MPSVSAATCKTVSKVAKMVFPFLQEKTGLFLSDGSTAFSLWQRCLAFSRFSGAQKEPGAGLSRSIISILLGRTVVPATS